MKNLLVSFICMFLIGFYTIFSFFYINNFTANMKSEINLLSNNQYNTTYIDNISSIFNKNKPILNMMINDDCIDDIENIFIELKYSAKYNDIQSAAKYSDLLLNIFEDIEGANRNII